MTAGALVPRVTRAETPRNHENAKQTKGHENTQAGKSTVSNVLTVQTPATAPPYKNCHTRRCQTLDWVDAAPARGDVEFLRNGRSNYADERFCNRNPGRLERRSFCGTS